MVTRGRKVADHQCEPKGAALLKIGEVASAQQLPAINADVWPSEGRANALYGDEAPICPHCWMAYLSPIGKWCRSLGHPDRFRVPLAASIREFPVPDGNLPTSTVVYNQLYGAGAYTESVGYWFERNDDFAESLRKYARQHGLSLDLEPGPTDRKDEVLVSASCSRRG
jgi:hypothetical protein